jgi:hypothetical protein
MSKKVNVKLSAKCDANKEDKESVYSLNQIQKRAIERYQDKKSKFYQFCQVNGILESDLQFSKILNFGTDRELNIFSKDKSGNWTKGEKRNHFSFWTFQNCLIRYRQSLTVKPEAKKQTKQTKQTAKTTAKPEVKAKPQTTVKSVKIEQKSETTAKPVKVAKVA